MDTDALGKYTWAMDRANKVCAELTHKTKVLGQELGHCHAHNFEDGLMPQFEATKVRALVDESSALYASLIELCHEANQYAPMCDKRLIRFSTPGREQV